MRVPATAILRGPGNFHRKNQGELLEKFYTRILSGIMIFSSDCSSPVVNFLKNLISKVNRLYN